MHAVKREQSTPVSDSSPSGPAHERLRSVRYVTALGATDEAAGWRNTKQTGGIVLEVPSGE